MLKRSLVIFVLSFIFPFHHIFASVVINEIFPKPTDETSEWIEIYNNGSDSVSLDRWSLENKSGNKFTLNASSIIQANSYLTFSQSQTGIKLSNEGDTIRLTDANGNQVDSQSYQGILGFNISMGRSVDGAGVWAICTLSTENKSNTCPAPTPTNTPLPSPIPSPTVVPTLEPTIIPTATIMVETSIQPTSIVTITATPIPEKPAPSNRLQSLGWVLVGLGIAWGSIVLFYFIHKTIHNRKTS